MVIVQIHTREIDPLRAKMVACNMAFARSHDIEYRLIEIPGSHIIATESNLVRLDMARRIPDMLYVDTDALIKSIPAFIENDRPYMEYYAGRPHHGVFYVNGACSFFERLIEAIPRVLGEDVQSYQPGWPMRVIESMKAGVVNRYPDDAYNHYFLTTRGEDNVRDDVRREVEAAGN